MCKTLLLVQRFPYTNVVHNNDITSVEEQGNFLKEAGKLLLVVDDTECSVLKENLPTWRSGHTHMHAKTPCTRACTPSP